MKMVDIIFVSDDLVGEMILPRKDYERQKMKKLKEEQKEKDFKDADNVPSTPKAKKRKMPVDEAVVEITPKKPKIQMGDDLEMALAALENEEVSIDNNHFNS